MLLTINIKAEGQSNTYFAKSWNEQIFAEWKHECDNESEAV